MAISENEFTRLAQLASFSLDSDQSSSLHGQLSAILASIAPLHQVDTTEITRMAHPPSHQHANRLRLRDDSARPTASVQARDALMENAPATADGLFLVPTVIE